jgi:two-component system OmpR family sensor kinase
VIRKGTFAPIAAAAIGLVGGLAASLSLYHTAANALDRSLEERLRGAGASTAAVLAGAQPEPERLRAIMRANGLDAVYVVDRRLHVVADANGPSGRRADLLRLDVGSLEAALSGATGVAPGYTFGALTVMTGYFPIPAPDGGRFVLVLEAGKTFVAPHARVARARDVAVSLSILSALGLALMVGRWNRAERHRREAAAVAARGQALSRVAAMAAHEIRNPLGVIRGTVDLMRERSAAKLTERDRRDLDGIAGEVERLRRLTQDLVDLSADRPLAWQATSIAELLSETARATEAGFPQVRVRCDIAPLPEVQADPARLRQVFANLLTNAAQAQREGEIRVQAEGDRDSVRVVVTDDGPGIPDDVRDNLFDLYFTTKSTGTGLGLAIARRFVERHGGTLVHLRDKAPGASFRVTLPTKQQLPT